MLTKHGSRHGINLMLQTHQFFFYWFKGRFSIFCPLKQTSFFGIPVGLLRLEPLFQLFIGG